jgi:hypothetical protein
MSFDRGLNMGSKKNQENRRYLKGERLADVMALIQVLALDELSHRSEGGLAKELQGKPYSAQTWTQVASEHPEFFRVKEAVTNCVSLLARHVAPKESGKRQVLSPDYTGKLLEIAVVMHDRQIRRKEQWRAFIPIVVASTAGAFTIFGIILKSWFH